MSRAVTACLGLLLLAIAGWTGTAAAQAEAGAQSLLISPGARPNAMGRANVAVADDATAVWWNPGGMAFAKGRDAAFMYTKLVPDLADDVYYSYLSYVQHVEGWGGLGGSLSYLSYGLSTATDIDGNTIKEFTSWEGALSVGYGAELSDNLGAGIGLKVVRVDLAPADVTQDRKKGAGTTFATDVGVLWKVPALPGFKSIPVALGAAVQNLGPDIAYIDEDQSDPLGRNLKVGFAVYPYSNESFRTIVAADLNRSLLPKSQWRDMIYDVGAEVEFNRLIALRVGYVRDKVGTIVDPTFGLGLMLKSIRVDYASVPQSTYLERVSRFSVSYHF
jgi:hypothetical protein